MFEWCCGYVLRIREQIPEVADLGEIGLRFQISLIVAHSRVSVIGRILCMQVEESTDKHF